MEVSILQSIYDNVGKSSNDETTGNILDALRRFGHHTRLEMR